MIKKHVLMKMTRQKALEKKGYLKQKVVLVRVPKNVNVEKSTQRQIHIDNVKKYVKIQMVAVHLRG